MTPPSEANASSGVTLPRPRSAKMSVHEPAFSFPRACVLAWSHVRDFDILQYILAGRYKINYKLRGPE